MRPVGDPLHQRIGADEQQHEESQADRQPVEAGLHRGADRQLQAHEHQRLTYRYGAARQRPDARSRHLRIEVAVDDVVERAAGAAHRYGADAEKRHQPPIGPSGRRQRDRPPAGKEQQPRADGPVEPGQPDIGNEPRRRVALRPIAAADVGHGVTEEEPRRHRCTERRQLARTARYSRLLCVSAPLWSIVLPMVRLVPASSCPPPAPRPSPPDDRARDPPLRHRRSRRRPFARAGAAAGALPPLCAAPGAGRGGGAVQRPRRRMAGPDRSLRARIPARSPSPSNGVPRIPARDLWLLFAPIKRARIDFLAEKATELGVAALLPGDDAAHRRRAGQSRPPAPPTPSRRPSRPSGWTVPEIASRASRCDRLLDGWPARGACCVCDETGAAPPIAEALVGAQGRPAGRADRAGGRLYRRRSLTPSRKLPFVSPVGLGPRCCAPIRRRSRPWPAGRRWPAIGARGRRRCVAPSRS